MAATIRMNIEGIEDLNRTLLELAPNEASNLVRTTVHGIASEIAGRIGAAAPFRHLRRGFRAVRRRELTRGKPVSEVRAKPIAADWRWFEFGTAERRQKTTGRRTGRIVARPFVTPTVEVARRELPAIYREQFGKKLEKALARRARKIT